MFGKEKNNIVHIKDIKELSLKKINPSDLSKVYIDEKGQEYKLRYDPVERKVKIIKVIKGKLDGTFVKSEYDKIAEDRKASVYVKYKIAEISKEKLTEEKPKEEKPVYKPVEAKSKPVIPVNVEKEKKIESLQDIFNIMEKMKGTLKIVEKNIYDSNVLSEKYSIDDKIILDDITRIINSNIIGEWTAIYERYEDILKGYEDTRLATKLYNPELRKIIEKKPPEIVKEFLRQLEIHNIFISGFENIIKGYNDIEYKLKVIPVERISARPFNERQKFDDAMFLMNSCKKDAEMILSFLKSEYNKLLS